MDLERVEYFKQRYSAMSDEELSFLLITRGEGLAEEARHALDVVMRRRDPRAIRQEMQATTEDLAAQAEHAHALALRQARREREVRLWTHYFCALAVVTGLLGALVGRHEAWLPLAGLAAALSAWIELRRLLGRLGAAIWRMEPARPAAGDVAHQAAAARTPGDRMRN